jgi:hypothetical protein
MNKDKNTALQQKCQVIKNSIPHLERSIVINRNVVDHPSGIWFLIQYTATVTSGSVEKKTRTVKV